MLSKKAKYALIAMLSLARKYGEGPIVISDLTEEEGIPRKFTELILLEMKNNGLLHSKKGKGGGYWLRKPPTEITLGTIIRLIDGPLAPVSCVSLTAYQKCEECQDEATCGIKLVMKEVRDSIANILDSTSLRDVLDKVSTQNQTIMYYI
ncbi:MAG: Rrf2 family transcriptional regulator [bacterium]